MRLIDVTTYQLVERIGQDIPPYAILSHTWGTQEVSFKDFGSEEWRIRDDKCEGRNKIVGCCAASYSEGFNFVWIDTCCIDKSSSAELSEAINSMFRWYRNASICYAYLDDVGSGHHPASEGSDFSKSRWFTRGWTLQELLAPAEVVFIARNWTELGTKRTLRETITQITQISLDALLDRDFTKYSIAQRMSWAADRYTTRPEDEAYSLMGLFDVNMPLLYGEGQKAFLRLQEEIMRRTHDESIFAWSYPVDQQSHVLLTGMLAPSPHLFKDSSKITVMVDNATDSSVAADRLNAIDLVRGLVRLRLKVFEGVKGIHLQPLATNLNLVLDAESSSYPSILDDTDTAQNGQDESSNQVTQNDAHESFPTNIEHELRVQAIPHPQILVAGNATGPASGETNANAKTGIGLDIIETEWTRRPGMRPNRDDTMKKTEPPSKWLWYIYEPVTLVPLMCAIEGRPLALLLAKSSFHARSMEENMVHRLHYPSLVCKGEEPIFPNEPSSGRTVFVPGFAKSEKVVGDRSELSFEIRIADMLAKGFTPSLEEGSRWVVDLEHKKLIRTSDEAERQYIVVFQHPGDESVTCPSFFLQMDFEEPIVGSLHGSKSSALDGGPWRLNFKNESRAAIRIGSTDEYITIKCRELSTVRYMSLSIECHDLEPKGAPALPLLSGHETLARRIRWMASSRLLNTPYKK